MFNWMEVPTLSWWTWSFSILAALIGGNCILVVYRVTFHPLARYPGPLLAKVTDLYPAYHAWLGDLHLDVLRCHHQYGDFIRYGPNKLTVNTSRGLHDIYGSSAHTKKSQAYMPMVPDSAGWNTVTVIDKKLHRQKRRLFSQAFSDAELVDFMPRYAERLGVFCIELAKDSGVDTWSSPKDMIHQCKKLTLDVMLELGFGQRHDMIRSRSSEFLIPILQSFNFRMGVCFQYPLLARLGVEKVARLLSLNSAIQRKWETWRDHFKDEVMDRAKTEDNGRFALFLNAKDPATQNRVPTQELWAEGSVWILAGADNSAITLSTAFFYITHSLDVYEKLAREVRTTFNSTDEIRPGQLLRSCTYLYACITEVMRISPSTPGVLWREVESEGHNIDGEVIGRGCDVGTCIYSIHHNGDCFPDPYNFRPERWIPGQWLSQSQIATARLALNNFSLGVRGCAGQNMAYYQITVAVAWVLFVCDIRRARGKAGEVGAGVVGAKNGRHRPDEFQLATCFTSIVNGPMVEFRKRCIARTSCDALKTDS